MVRVEMAEEDVVDRETAAVAHHLPLRALAAIEQQRVAAAVHHDGADVAPDRGPGRSSAQECDSNHARGA